MSKELAIDIEDVTKVYHLYGSQRDQLIDVLGLKRLGFGMSGEAREFNALTDISLKVPKGHRIGIVGRNGAGKTTLLKLICGNFAPTSGKITVSGTVQALLGMGLGFHPDYTGRENVIASLQYNGLSTLEYAAAIEDVIEFCELGDFIDQPFKTYSLGMQARLMFAAATAVKPDILIIDEVLGAGDAYFIAKSKRRVEKLINSGCTMLLVSHSMQQVLELCDEAIWLDGGKIKMIGDSFRVVKSYEEYIHGPSKDVEDVKLDVENLNEFQNSNLSLAQPESNIDDGETPDSDGKRYRTEIDREELILQEPDFLPHKLTPPIDISNGSEVLAFDFQAPGGISRWKSDIGVKISGFTILTENGVSNVLMPFKPAIIRFQLRIEESCSFKLRYGVAIHDLNGICMTRIFSPQDLFHGVAGDLRDVEMSLNPNQIGPGEYTLGISVLHYDSLEALNSTKRYDLLSRSFSLKVEMQDSLAAIAAAYFHTAEWQFRAKNINA